ncbi:MAG: hypothetical protein JWN34_220 [Bryobacterales bacterium]|nr:hypothetical protein [Bryobacterales bacterium]
MCDATRSAEFLHEERYSGVSTQTPMRNLLALTSALAMGLPTWAAMPSAEQNGLVKQYCAVCHTDEASNGGLSLEHYDAARPDPTLAAMMLTELNNGAMGAAGKGVPDKAAQLAWVESTKEQAAGASEWVVHRDSGTVSAAIVRAVPPRMLNSTNAPLYRMQLACTPSTGAGEMQLTWSPEPQINRSVTVSADSKEPIAYRIDGLESMGNGNTVKTGRASVILSAGRDRKLPLPRHTLVIQSLFDGETVKFPFGDLSETALTELSNCFSQ